MTTVQITSKAFAAHVRRTVVLRKSRDGWSYVQTLLPALTLSAAILAAVVR